MALLRVCNGKHQGREFVIPAVTITVGREEGCDIRLSSSRVSRRHCTIEVTDAGVVVTDLGSRNGTLVNGERLASQRLLYVGDRLGIGPWEFELAGALSEAAQVDEGAIADWLQTGESVGSGDTTMIPSQVPVCRRGSC